jgi:hypothetical protein
MIPGIIPMVTCFNFNVPYMASTYRFGHDDHSCVPSHFLLEGFFDALDAQYLCFFPDPMHWGSRTHLVTSYRLTPVSST